MTLSRNTAAYPDVVAVLDAALLHNGAKYTLDNYRDAFTFRAKAHRLRQLLRERRADELRLRGVFGTAPTTPYDRMVLSIEHEPDHKAAWKLAKQGLEPAKECTVRIWFPTAPGRLATLDGTPVPLDVPAPGASDLVSTADDFLAEFTAALTAPEKQP